MKQHHCLHHVFVITALLGILCTPLSHASDEDDYLLDMQQLITDGQTGVGLFPIQVPGETFAAERSQIGHKVTDFTLSGNGIAGFGLVRKYQESPAIEPFAFGNMSIELPMLKFRIKLNLRDGNTPSDQAFDMTCSHMSASGIEDNDWRTNPDWAVTELYNDMVFSNAQGNISLLPRALVNDTLLANYPADALLVSKDNYYLKCDGPTYVLYAPDGTTFHFDAAVSADRILSDTTKVVSGDDDTNFPYRSYRVRATTIKRHNSTINLSYELLRDIVVKRTGYVEERDSRARTPLAPTRYNLISSSSRLKHVTLIAAHDSNPGKPAFHEIDIEYFANSDTNCPGLVKNIRQTYQDNPSAGVSLVHQKRYNYRQLNFVEQGLIAAPRSGCILSSVEHADEHNSGQFIEQWGFSYGSYNKNDSQSIMLTGRGETEIPARGAWDTSKIFETTFLRLQSVVTPTDSKVTYQYVPLKPCQYQDFQKNNSAEVCGNSNASINAVLKRTVQYRSDGGLKTQVRDFETSRHNSLEYQTTIDNEEIQHRLVFGRSFPQAEQPSDSLDNATNIRFINGGKLLTHEVRRQSNLSDILTTATFEYKENTIFPKTHLYRPWVGYREPDDTYDQGWGWRNARRSYLLNHRRVNRYKTTTSFDGQTYVKDFNLFGTYNYPRNLLEKYVGRTGQSHQRNTTFVYDNNHGGKNGWYVGLLAKTLRRAGSDSLISETTYNTYGLPSSKTNAGIASQYQYHLNGNVKAVINGNGHSTTFSNHKHGVPTTIASPENGLTTRVVDSRGNITQENVRKEGGQFNTTNYQYADPYSRVSSAQPPGGVSQIVYAYPNWRGSDNARVETMTRGRQQSITQYDSLGRVDYAGRKDLQSGQLRVVNTVYDQLGRVVKTSDVGSNPSSTTGMLYTYDVLGRVTSARHTADAGSVLYCYGSDCSASSHNGNFSGAGAVKDGYAVRDQSGAVSIYNFRAYGAPEDYQLVEIRQQIVAPSSYKHSSDKVLVTTIERNEPGIVTRVSQGPGDNPAKHIDRIYVPHKANGSLTYLTKSESHPEFKKLPEYDGTKVVNTFDGVGNPISVTNFDGSTHTYTYDNQERLVFHQTPGSTEDIDTAGTLGYSDYANGSLKTISSNGGVWTYDYNGNNLLSDGTLSFAGETFTFGYDYDDELNVSRIDYPSGDAVTYAHNGFGEQKSAGDYVSSASYHASGHLNSMTLGSGEVYSATLNSRKRINNISVDTTNGAGNVMTPLDLTYEFTPRGNVASITGYFNRGIGYSQNLSNLQYDGLSRLHQATGNWGTSNTVANFSYDPWGNIDKRYVGGVNLDYTYDSDTKPGQLKTATFSGDSGMNYNRVFTYDGNGNVTSDGVKTFQYDHLNRLVRAETDSVTVQSNSYDGHGHRMRTIVNDGQRNRTTFFLYDPSGTLLHEFDKESGEQRDHIQLAGRRIATKGIHQKHDSDGDGMPDYFERLYGLAIFSAGNANDDSDGDGLTDLEEYELGQIPTSTDSDMDSQTDGAEFPSYLAGSSGSSGSTLTGIELQPIFDYLLTD